VSAPRIVVVVAATMLAFAGGEASQGVRSAGSACDSTGKLVGHSVVYCGTATARLSVFTCAVFKSGSCQTTKVNGVPHFAVRLGARTQNARTNDGRPYFGLIETGSLQNPTGGGAIAYWKGKRWGGVGVAFKGSASGGTFVARGINGSRGRASGSFTC
jgi:hypothetical protein